jgi:choline transporter-like protein 2/4/5
LQWFNLFALYWSINFVTSLGELVLAGVFATWYWTWDKVLLLIILMHR